MGSFKYLVDWRNRGFICKWCQRTDRLQSLPTWLDPLNYTAWRVDETNVVATIETITASNTYESKYFGKYYFKGTVTGATSEGIKIFSDGLGFDVTTTNTRTYTVVLWVRCDPASDAYSSFDYRVRLYSNSYSTVEATATGTAQETAWTRVSLSYTASASNNLVIQVVKTNASARNFFVSGIMVFESTGAITAPDGYNTGYATDNYEDITPEVKGASWQVGMFKPYQQMADEGVANLALDNSAGLFTPENTTSPLYGYVTPTLWFEIGHWLGGAMQNFRVMYTGQLDSPPVRIPYEGMATNTGKTEATLTAISNKIWLDKQAFELAYVSGQNTGLTIKDILGFTNFASTQATFNYIGLTGARAGTVTNYAPQSNDNAWIAIQDLVAVEEGKFYLDRGGTINLLSRYYSYSGSASYDWSNHGDSGTPSVNIGTISDSGTYKPYRNNLQYAYGANYVNRIRLTVHPRKANASGTVWSNTDIEFDIEPGGTELMFVRLRDSLGRFTTADSVSISVLTYSAGTATTTATAMGGKVKIEFVNSGSVTATLDNLSLTGASNSQQSDIGIEVGSAGTATYGIRMQTYDLPACGSARDGRKIARHILNRDNVFQGYVYSVPFNNKGDGTANSHQLQWTIGSKVNVDLDSIYHNRDYWIIGEKHSVDLDGEYHTTNFALEPVNTTSFWLAGVEGFSNAGVSTRAGY